MSLPDGDSGNALAAPLSPRDAPRNPGQGGERTATAQQQLASDRAAASEEGSAIIAAETPDQTLASTTIPPPEEKKPAVRLCVVCDKEPGKYKCPMCAMPYCSVACNRTHKENHPPPQPRTTEDPKAQAAAAPPPGPASAAAVDNDPYSVLLEHRSEFTRLLQKYPVLEQELARIEQTTLPPGNGGSGDGSGLAYKMQQQAQLAAQGASGGGHNNKRQKSEPMWSRDVGLRKGADALRKARTDPGDRGDAVREFCDLVLYLLSTKPGGANDATRLVRQEVAAEEAKIVERLLQEEQQQQDRF
ncbi:hypothetical protein B0H63DRAFT_150499 [Podospora didyma]|uniref:HIT-type domain-containing protein n=1 Tax=Podospora didyma TaxID=330526 RepID=A0AAE0NT04_9PEZI|nr:hypothetical protein B0H63DRAFT_150499 [Podospora didyma]